ncbi:MAG: GatB/YqeY domain-containing protein [Candidatus Pacebacteria bacterium]|nr:GatB/YqeY domain-containing protein [Candidatus Paceibacterota bacterium]MBP9058249.1 GatB/YqeY domain-containing protein [Candidatus Paceibacterota bacterium]MBP9770185.1 GatB/YqeY domain-containing protein [Candidatus Paceibacterota bacterium]
MLHDQIKEKIKESMLARDQVMLASYRAILAGIGTEVTGRGMKPSEMLDDEGVISVITKLVKQRKDAISQFRAAGRNDLADEDQTQLDLFETFLPKMMSEEEIETFAKAKIAEMGEIDKSKSGMILGALMKDLKGKADGADVKKVVEKLLN